MSRLQAASFGGWIVIFFSLGAAATAQEAGDPPGQHAAIEALQECRPLADAVAKAACYDAAMDGLLAELESGALITLSRADVEEARRESIGLPSLRLPQLDRFLSGEDATETASPNSLSDPEPGPVTVQVASYSVSPAGRLSFVTETGQEWSQVGTDAVRGLPDPPFEVELRPAFGDTYFFSVRGLRAIRIRRDR